MKKLKNKNEKVAQGRLVDHLGLFTIKIDDSLKTWEDMDLNVWVVLQSGQYVVHGFRSRLFLHSNDAANHWTPRSIVVTQLVRRTERNRRQKMSLMNCFPFPFAESYMKKTRKVKIE